MNSTGKDREIIWIVEWCASGTQRGLFNIHSLEANIDTALERFFGRLPGCDEWIILGHFKTIDEASSYAEKLDELQESGQAGGFDNKPKLVVPMGSEGSEYLRGLPYSEYLKTSHWAQVRTRILQVAQGRCQLCNSADNPQVHHRTYIRRGRELYSDLIVLCNVCHKVFHDRIGVVREFRK